MKSPAPPSRDRAFRRLLSWSKERWLDLLLVVLAAAGIVHAGYYLLAGLSNPLIDFFGFRQTQTAISAYWILKGGPLVAYETPVLGAPWAVPFEFPLYQWMAAGLAVLGVPLDAAGRLVSFTFFLLCLLPARLIFKDLGFDRAQFLVFAVIFLFAPIYVFYSRTFMIESTALFFGAMWLALILRFTQRGGWLTLTVAAAAGVLGILVKSTTFATFGLLAAFTVAAPFFRGRALRFGGGRLIVDAETCARCFAAGVLCVVVLAVGLAWVQYTDQIKSANPSALRIISGNLRDFNYGPLELRWSGRLWDEAILKRAAPEAFGAVIPIAFSAFGAALAARRHALFAGIALLAAIIPLLLFANLHRVHDYYQYANAVFAIAAVALGLGALISLQRRGLAVALLVGIVLSQLMQFNAQFRPAIVSDGTGRSRYKAGLAARQVTSPDEALLVLGDDWSSEIPYYAQRKSFAVPGWGDEEDFRRVIDEPEEFLGGLRLGAIVVCNPERYGEQRAAMVKEFISRQPLIADVGGCQVHAPAAG